MVRRRNNSKTPTATKAANSTVAVRRELGASSLTTKTLSTATVLAHPLVNIEREQRVRNSRVDGL